METLRSKPKLTSSEPLFEFSKVCESLGYSQQNLVSWILEEIIKKNDKSPSDYDTSSFRAKVTPSISITDYLKRIMKYTSCNVNIFLFALIYIDRFLQRSKNSISLTSKNVHRLFITAFLLGSKFHDDVYYNNLYYAQVGGISVQELNSLELEFLFMINFDLHCPVNLYQSYLLELITAPNKMTM